MRYVKQKSTGRYLHAESGGDPSKPEHLQIMLDDVSRNRSIDLSDLEAGYGDDVEIVSGGCKFGADKYAKKFALEFDMKYVEFPAVHESYNIQCNLPKYKYGKPYAVWHFFERNKEIAK